MVVLVKSSNPNRMKKICVAIKKLDMTLLKKLESIQAVQQQEILIVLIFKTV